MIGHFNNYASSSLYSISYFKDSFPSGCKILPDRLKTCFLTKTETHLVFAYQDFQHPVSLYSKINGNNTFKAFTSNWQVEVV